MPPRWLRTGCPSHRLCICCDTNNRVQSEMSQVFCNRDDAHVDGLLSISTADTLAVSNVISASNRYPEWVGEL